MPLQAASTNSKGHTIQKLKGSSIILDDFNNLLTLAKRINTAWTGSAAEGGRIKGITDLIMGPEQVKGLRAMAYNPVNTNTRGAGTSDIAATDDMRNAIYNNAGVPEFFGISIMEINELGENVAAATSQAKLTKVYETLSGGAANSVADVVIGLDRSRESLFRAVALDAETGSEFSLNADDQYSIRQQKIGYYGSLEEGRMILDDRVLTGFVFDG